jgi:hypothetical protein
MEWIETTEDGKVIKAKWVVYTGVRDTERLRVDLYMKKKVLFFFPVFILIELKPRQEINYTFDDALDWTLDDYKRRAINQINSVFRLTIQEKAKFVYLEKCKDFEAIKDIDKKDLAILELLT